MATLSLGNLNKKHLPNKNWPKEKKLQAVVQWLALGNLKLVSTMTGVSHGVLKQWRIQPWWKEYEAEIRNTENLELDNKLTKIVQRSLDAVADRLENGESVLNLKTGEVVRKPVSMKDAAKVTTDMLTKRELLRGNATARTETATVSINEQMKMLAQEFAKMATRKPGDVIDVESRPILPGEVDEYLDEENDLAVHEEGSEDGEVCKGLWSGSQGVHQPTRGSEETDGAECSPSGNGESRISS